MHIAIFIVYAILCGYAILKLPLFRRTGIPPAMLLFFFEVHVAVGCLHNLIAWRYYPGHGDIWDSFQWSLLLRNWLHTDFQHFLLANSRWTYFTHNGIIFIQMALNFFSFDNLYVNTLLFSFPVFLGNTALFLAFRRWFPGNPLLALLVFLLPSTLFWTACIFREGVLYMLLGFLCYRFAFPPLRRRALWFCSCFLLILYFRFTVAAFIIPALLVSRWTEYPPRRLLLPAIGVAASVLLLCLAVPAIPGFVLHGLARWQAEFQVLEGHSRLYLPAIDGTWASLFHTAPYALLNGFFQPLPGAGGRGIYLAFSVELAIVWALVAAAAIRGLSGRRTARREPPPFPGPASSHLNPPPPSDPAPIRARPPLQPAPQPALQPALQHAPQPAIQPALQPAPQGAPPSAPQRDMSAACLVFAFLGMLAVGAIVPFAGAIVRYRSLYLPFLLAPALQALRNTSPVQRVNRWLRNRLKIII